MVHRAVISPYNSKEVEEQHGWVTEAGSPTLVIVKGRPHTQALCLLVQQSLCCTRFFPLHDPWWLTCDVLASKERQPFFSEARLSPSLILPISCPGPSLICLLVLETQTP